MKGEATRTVVHKVIRTIAGQPRELLPFRNYYECPNDGTRWSDEWTCACDDRCPLCNAEIEPYLSDDLEPAIDE